ncbi:MAG TPA: metallophosphoesterase [Candidatus Omnitrophota bacterium]|nr:metallophosphoesterase [Candidatus Omnitrophota bacterium]HPS36518.1 metallophosphoesterase [Candidatus Omnitrophota bacterium]
MRTFVMGDIHGAHKAFLQCLERSGFDRAKDWLIVLGDVCDVYPEVRQCIDELISLKHCDYVIGNHDLWTLDWAIRGLKPDLWLEQGGDQTILSYGGDLMLPKHVDFLNKAHSCLEVNGCAYVHAGFDPNQPLKTQSLKVLAWDRDLLRRAWEEKKAGRNHPIGCYREIFLGHTPSCVFLEGTFPLHLCNVWAMDTGAGWNGPLTIMDVASKEYWQSDPTSALYDGMGRSKRGD